MGLRCGLHYSHPAAGHLECLLTWIAQATDRDQLAYLHDALAQVSYDLSHRELDLLEAEVPA